MPGEIRVDTIKSNSGLGTITCNSSGQVLAGITTIERLNNVSTLSPTVGVGTITLNASGQVLAGITTVSDLRVGTAVTANTLGVQVGAGKSLRLYGQTSGYVDITTNAAAGISTFTLPTDDGTSGQYLQTDGTGVLSWSTVTSTGRLTGVSVLTSGTTYTTPPTTTAIYVECVGAGGGGGYFVNVPTARPGGAGGSGGYSAKYFPVSGNTPYTYAIGSPGGGATQGAPSTGQSGGNTTFTVGAVQMSAGGGQGGQGASAPAPGNPGAGGSSSNGDLNSSGGAGAGNPGVGGSGFFGGPGSFGSGGPAPGSGASAGGAAVIRVWEFT